MSTRIPNIYDVEQAFSAAVAHASLAAATAILEQVAGTESIRAIDKACYPAIIEALRRGTASAT
jgi:hypothetical protein